ncbi:MAG: FliM/FliN family flagellar motor switch protein [Candidatus Saccharibacteria bacterium]|nr:FliM/FliN family flagellar motor switch protein [Pseudorhodobacter sp.]
MASAGHNIIRRKVAAVKTATVTGGPGADRSWRVALARAVRDKLQTTLDFRKLAVEQRSLAEIIELSPSRALIAVLDGPGEGLGIIALDPQIMAGFIEAQTIGKVKSTEIVARKTTRTDAAMVAGVIDAALQGLELALADEADLIWAGGFRYASFLDDPRQLGLLMEDVSYKVLRAEVDLAGGARKGEVMLALPADGRGASAPAKIDDPLAPDTTHSFMHDLSERVNGAQCRIEAVLARLTLPLAQVMHLTEGMVLALPDASLTQISLEGFDGRRVGEGKLGQNRGMRAVRLTEAAHQGGLSVMGGLDDLGTPQASSGGFGPVSADPGGPDFGGMDLNNGFPAMDLGSMTFQATGTD